MLAHVNQMDLFYEVIGEGRPLLMVHGNGEDHTVFYEAAEVLKETFCCYLPDSRGHGQSTPVKEYHYADMADDMIALMEALDLTDVTFYGFSDGGIIGLLAAMKCERITKLIISGANITPKGLRTMAHLRFRIRYFFKKDPLIALMLREPNITDSDLTKIHVPTLVTAGDNDLIKEKETRHIARAVAGAQLRILKGEGHATYVVHSPKIGEIILDYMGCRHTAEAGPPLT